MTGITLMTGPKQPMLKENQEKNLSTAIVLLRSRLITIQTDLISEWSLIILMKSLHNLRRRLSNRRGKEVRKR